MAILESRMTDQAAALLARAGLETFSAPALHEEPVDASGPVAAFISELAARRMQVVVLLTGVGLRALVREADRAGRRDELLDGLRAATLACRGPKPVAALRECGIVPQIVAPEPNTSETLLAAMAPLALTGAHVGLVHYGERNGMLVDALRARGATVIEISLYTWRLPDDTGPLRELVARVTAGRIDAVAFTSQIQVRHLFQIATELGRADELREALRTRTLVASIGPTCSGVLEEFGVRPAVAPEHPKLGHLVRALAARLNGAVASSPDADPSSGAPLR